MRPTLRYRRGSLRYVRYPPRVTGGLHKESMVATAGAMDDLGAMNRDTVAS
jgi:hypothetical protein